MQFNISTWWYILHSCQFFFILFLLFTYTSPAASSTIICITILYATLTLLYAMF